MAHIALVINDLGSRKPEVLSMLRKQSQLALGDIIARAGKDVAVCQLDLFGVDLPQRAENFKALVKQISEAGATITMFQLMEGEELPTPGALQADVAMIDRMVAAHIREEKHHDETV